MTSAGMSIIDSMRDVSDDLHSMVLLFTRRPTKIKYWIFHFLRSYGSETATLRLAELAQNTSLKWR
jgi:hypothetical protein